jgi:hypothetical protein
MYLFKESNVWVFGATIHSICPAGCFRLEPSYDRESVTVRSVIDGKAIIFNKPVEDILKPDGSGYADFDGFLENCSGFFSAESPFPNSLTIPDEVDTTDGAVIYMGYIRGGSYLICQRVINGATISTKWATGDWADRTELFEEPMA